MTLIWWGAEVLMPHRCIICQCSFEHNDMALTLPCAHVFHEGAVALMSDHPDLLN
jgi:hypothetical protein